MTPHPTFEKANGTIQDIKDVEGAIAKMEAFIAKTGRVDWDLNRDIQNRFIDLELQGYPGFVEMLTADLGAAIVTGCRRHGVRMSPLHGI